jgi:hypothetical protein
LVEKLLLIYCRTFQFFYFYSILAIEERVESLVYDVPTLLVATGGNLGLFLGFSCLSVGLGMIKLLKKYIA